MNNPNWKQIYAKKKAAENRILAICPNIPNSSGIYVFMREENEIKYAYVGQAKDLKRRCADHLLGYSHIDNSLKKHGLYDNLKNPNGYKLKWTSYPIENLDQAERDTINFFANNGYQLRNNTIGGQDNGKAGLGDGVSTKGYRDGIKQGYENAKRDICEFFTKYLDYSMKEPYLTKKGKVQEIKQRKFNEFTEWLKGEKTDE